jgi:hypothetical protein
MQHKTAVMAGPSKRFRYLLTRSVEPWGDLLHSERIAFVGVNPSTADAERDDPTIRKCWRFTEKWGFKGFAMLNLFAYRATDPHLLSRADDPIGPENDVFLANFASCVKYLVCMWGRNGRLNDRDHEVIELLQRHGGTDCLRHLKRNADGTPSHILYLPEDLKPMEYWG